MLGLAVLWATAYALPELGDGWDDPDSLMRLVEVRDLLAGQGWYDLRQMRLMPPDGVFMHWSRLVDAPIALIIRLAGLWLPPGEAERLAVNLWPPLLLVPFLAGLAAIAHRFAGWTGAGWTLVFFVLSPAVGSVFQPGRLDHHNVQAVLVAGLVAALVRAARGWREGAAAGVLAAVSLAVGMEMLALIATAIAGLGLAWVVEGERFRKAAIGFGLAFAAAVPTLFLATVGPDRWSTPACDALSSVHLVLALVGGLGLSTIARTLAGDETMAGRLVRGGSLVVLAALVLAVAAIRFPLCLAGPYAGLDPALGPVWLDHITEAKSLMQLFAEDWTTVPVHYGPPLLTALLVLGVAREAPSADRAGLIALAGLILASFAVGAVQIRGIVAAQTVAVAAAAVVTARAWRGDGPLGLRGALRRAVWVPLAPVAWFLLLLPAMDGERIDLRAEGDASVATCRAELGSALAGAAPQVIVAPDTLGAYLLMRTPHAVVAAPYHRGGSGILTVDRILTAPEGIDRARLADAGAGYVALCPADRGLAPVIERAPDGLAARIVAARPPGFLLPLLETPDTRLYRVQPAAPDPPEITGSLSDQGLRPSLR